MAERLLKEGGLTRRCPHCSRELQEAAVTCRYCDEFMPPQEPSRYDVVLVYPGCRGLEVIATVSDLTGLPTTSSRRLVMACRDGPQALLRRLPVDHAAGAWITLKHVGATAKIVESGPPERRQDFG